MLRWRVGGRRTERSPWQASIVISSAPVHCRRNCVRRLPISAFIVLLAGCAAHPDAPAPVRIAIGGQVQLIYLAATMAQELGYYKDENLAVELQDFPGGQKSLEALLGGSTDVVCGFYDHTIEMAAKGRPLTSFVTILR